MFFYTVLTIHLVLCFILVALVLLQQGKGADMGATLSGGSNTVFGAGGATAFVVRTTTMVAIAFMVTSVLLVRVYNQVNLAGGEAGPSDILQGSLLKEEPKAPVGAEGATGATTTEGSGAAPVAGTAAPAAGTAASAGTAAPAAGAAAPAADAAAPAADAGASESPSASVAAPAPSEPKPMVPESGANSPEGRHALGAPATSQDIGSGPGSDVASSTVGDGPAAGQAGRESPMDGEKK